MGIWVWASLTIMHVHWHWQVLVWWGVVEDRGGGVRGDPRGQSVTGGKVLRLVHSTDRILAPLTQGTELFSLFVHLSTYI